MAALSGPRMNPSVNIKTIMLPLASGAKAFRGGLACGDTATGLVKQGQASTTLIPIGQFQDDVDNTAGPNSVFVNVTLAREIEAFWYDNDTGANKVVASTLFNNVYALDDHTVTKNSSGNSIVGRVWAVDATLGALVQPNQF